MKKIRLQAHRGVASDCPENTMSAFIRAKQEGYDIIELDPAYTSDGKFIIMHDHTLNRTGRLSDGSPIPVEKKVAETTLEEVRSYDFGLHKGEEFKGEKAPLLEEVLAFALKENIPLKIDNKFEKFPDELRAEFIDIIETSGAPVGFTCANKDNLIALSKRFPLAEMHYDGFITEEILQELNKEIGYDRLTVWSPYKNDLTTWVKVAFISEDLVNLISKYGKVGAWILENPTEFEDIKNFNINVVETTGGIKPNK